MTVTLSLSPPPPLPPSPSSHLPCIRPAGTYNVTLLNNQNQLTNGLELVNERKKHSFMELC